MFWEFMLWADYQKGYGWPCNVHDLPSDVVMAIMMMQSYLESGKFPQDDDLKVKP